VSAAFVCPRDFPAQHIRAILRRLPAVSGRPVRVEFVRGLRDRKGDVHGGAFLRQRRIALNCTRRELPRIFVHELFHFVWLRAGNPMRHAYELLLEDELRSAARGELGWSAEWRKAKLTSGDIARRTRRWREYCCESFCDSAAWLYSGVADHEEFTLGRRFRSVRKNWFTATTGARRLEI
jgi:hypothetical protein